MINRHSTLVLVQLDILGFLNLKTVKELFSILEESFLVYSKEKRESNEEKDPRYTRFPYTFLATKKAVIYNIVTHFLQ